MWYFYTVLSLAAIASMIAFLIKHGQLLLALEYIRNVDIILAKYHINVSYHKEYQMMYTTIITYCILGIFSETAISQIRERTLIYILCDIVTFGISMALRTNVLLNFGTIVKILRQHFNHINVLCIKMGCKDEMRDLTFITSDEHDNYRENYRSTENDVEIYQLFRHITKMHETLCFAAKRLNEAFQTALAFHVGVNMVVFIIFIYLAVINDNSVSLGEYLFYGLLFTVELLLLLGQVETLQYEVCIIKMHYNNDLNYI